MNGLIFCFVTFLALANGKSFIPVVYHGTFGVNPYVNPYTAPYVFQTPQVPTPTFKSSAVVNVPDVSVAPVATYQVAPALNTYHAQSKDGSYSFGYFGGPSSRTESRDTFGNVHGAFNYVDSEGKIQSQQYVADANGFRVAATNLPLAPVVADVYAPNPVEDTPEVKAAKKEFDQTFQKAKQGFRVKRDAEPDFVSATAYKVPASTAPLNRVVSHIPVPTTYSVAPFVPNVHPFFPNFFSVSPKAVVPTVYNVPTVQSNDPKIESVVPTLYTVPSSHDVVPKVKSSGPKVYTVPNTFPITYSAAGFPYPFTYGSPIHPVFKFGKDSTVTKITHHPEAVSYRVDS